MFDRKVDTVGSIPEPKVTTLQRGVEKGGSIFGFAVAALVIAMLFGGVLAYRYFSLKTELDQITQLAEQAQTEFTALKPTAADIKTVATIVKALKGADEQRLLYDSILSAIARESLKNVSYKSVSVDATGRVVLAGEVGSYNDFARVVKAFRQASGETTGLSPVINIDQITQGQTTATTEADAKLVTDFIISFNLDPSLYKPVKSSQVDAAATTDTTVDNTTVDNTTTVDSTDSSLPTEVPVEQTTGSTENNSDSGLLDAFDQSTNEPPSNSSL